jgi:periplasmic divalent cation tolerance protein
MAGNGAGSGYLQVQTTTDTRAEAMELARAAVQARIAACGQVAGPIASTYWWDEDVERAEEWFVFFKLPADRYDELAAFLTQRHSYDEPEIIAVPIVAGTAGYLDWLREETRHEEAGRGEAGHGEAGRDEGANVDANVDEGESVPAPRSPAGENAAGAPARGAAAPGA